MKAKRALILLVAMFAAMSAVACTDDPSLLPPSASASATVTVRRVGTPRSMLDEAIRSHMGLRSRFTFLTDSRARIDVLADDVQVAGEYLSASGTVPGSPGSSFILKGDPHQVYGWVVLPDRDLAYEYTTSSDGQVVVQQVPVTKIFDVCDADREAFDEGAPLPDDSLALDLGSGGPPHIGPLDETADSNKLQSKPGAPRVLFMDLAPLPLPKPQLWRAWQIVAATFSAFDVNVTTDAAVYDATPASARGKVCSRPQAGRSSCGLNAFGSSRCCNVFNKGNGYYQGTTTAHELGHLLGLRHDGTAAGAYFAGLNEFRWAPIMGASTPKTRWAGQALFQWSKGEYAGANNKEDDLQLISRYLPFRADDIATSKPLIIRAGAQVAAADNFGQIAQNSDSDTFTFTVSGSGGRAMLTIDRIEDIGGGYLDVEAQIQNTAGMVLAKGNDPVARTAKLDVMLPAGDYKLVIKGGAEGTPLAGFSNYSSLGFYGISGTIAAAVAGGGGPTDGGGPADGGGSTDGGGAPDGGGGDTAGGSDARGGGGAAGSRDAQADSPPEVAAGGPVTGGGDGTGTGGRGGGQAGGRGGSSAGAGGSASEPGPRRGVAGGLGCSVADPSTRPSGSTVGLLLLLASASFARTRRRRRS